MNLIVGGGEELIENDRGVRFVAVGGENVPHEVHVVLDRISVEDYLARETLDIEDSTMVVKVGILLIVIRVSGDGH